MSVFPECRISILSLFLTQCPALSLVAHASILSLIGWWAEQLLFGSLEKTGAGASLLNLSTLLRLICSEVTISSSYFTNIVARFWFYRTYKNFFSRSKSGCHDVIRLLWELISESPARLHAIQANGGLSKLGSQSSIYKRGLENTGQDIRPDNLFSLYDVNGEDPG